jgi:hypothetical protein
MFQKLKDMAVLNHLGDMISNGKAEPEDVRGQLRELWASLGVVAALILTLIPFTGSVECKLKDDPFVDCMSGRIPVNEVHVVLSGIALMGSVICVTTSTLLYGMLGILPVGSIAEFIQEFPLALGFPTVSMQVGLWFWILDSLWSAEFTHGSRTVLPISLTLLLTLILCYRLFRRMSSFIREEIQRSCESRGDEGLRDSTELLASTGSKQ